MTIDECKSELPDVMVETLDGRFVECRTAGRERPFATVYNPQTAECFCVAWAIVADSATTGEVITLG